MSFYGNRNVTAANRKSRRVLCVLTTFRFVVVEGLFGSGRDWRAADNCRRRSPASCLAVGQRRRSRIWRRRSINDHNVGGTSTSNLVNSFSRRDRLTAEIRYLKKKGKRIKNGSAGQHLSNTFKTAVMAVGRSKVIFGLAIGGNVARQFNFRQRCAQILINIQLKACG